MFRRAVAVISTLALFSTQAIAQGAPPVTAAKPVVREVADVDEFVGRFEAISSVEVRARVGGYLEEIRFRDGVTVKEGDPLFLIDQRPFQIALAQAEAELEIAQSTLTFAQQQFERADQLARTGSGAIASLDERRRELLSAEAGLRGAQAAKDQAELELAYTEITAPLSGRIDRHLVSTGNLIAADQTVLTTIVSADPIDFYFNVDERRYLSYAEAARARGGSLNEGGGAISVTIRIGDTQQTAVTGELDFAENRIDPETGTMRLRARVPNADLMLQPGLFGRVEIAASDSYQGILVPDEAVASDQNQRVVFSVDAEGNVTPLPVRLGPRLFGYRVIREGLTGEETIIINGLVRVRPGQKVAPQIVELPPEADGLQTGAAP